ESLRDKLKEGNRTIEVFDQVLPRVSERGSVWEVVLDEPARQVGDQDLPAMRCRTDPRSEVDGEPRQTLVGDGGLAGVDAHPNAHVRALRPRVGSQTTLGLDRRGDGILRSGEHDEECVALPVDNPAPGKVEGSSKQSTMIRKGPFVVVPQRLE